MKTPAKFQVMCSPSGWGVYEVSTNKCVKHFSCSPADRIEALKVAYELNGWKMPKIWR